MKYKKMFLFLLISIIMVLPIKALADTGPKFSFKVNITNIDTTDYTIEADTGCWVYGSPDSGNETHTHEFHSMCNRDFIISLTLDGKTRKTKTIKLITDGEYVLDANTMEVSTNTSDNFNTIIHIVVILLITIVIELLIALIAKIGKYHIIALTNLVTNLALQLLMLKVFGSLTSFIIMEILVVLIETLLYLKLIKNNKTKIIIYTIIANLATALLTFFIF